MEVTKISKNVSLLPFTFNLDFADDLMVHGYGFVVMSIIKLPNNASLKI